MRVVVLGGGFGGVTTARHLERALRGHTGAEITQRGTGIKLVGQ